MATSWSVNSQARQCSTQAFTRFRTSWRLQTIARVLTLLGHYNCMSASRTCCSVRSAINTCTRCSAKNTVAMRLAKNAGATSCSIRMLCFRCRSGFFSATHCIGAFVPRIVAIASHLLSQFLARPGCALVRGLHRPLIGVLLYAMDCDFARGGSRPRIA